MENEMNSDEDLKSPERTRHVACLGRAETAHTDGDEIEPGHAGRREDELTSEIERVVAQICNQVGCGPAALLRVRRVARILGPDATPKTVRGLICRGRLHRHPAFPADWRCSVLAVARFLVLGAS